MQTSPNLSIPNWDASGLIPPIDPENPTSKARSPYFATLGELTVQFGTTPERLALLDGLLQYRQMWHQAGSHLGFQWIDGSFVEDKERNLGSAPDDIDVVTFFVVPPGFSQETFVATYQQLFDQERIKAVLKIHAFFVVLNDIDPVRLIERSVYWSSVFSHSRENLWKGYIQIDLADQADANLRQDIAVELNRMGGHGH